MHTSSCVVSVTCDCDGTWVTVKVDSPIYIFQMVSFRKHPKYARGDRVHGLNFDVLEGYGSRASASSMESDLQAASLPSSFRRPRLKLNRQASPMLRQPFSLISASLATLVRYQQSFAFLWHTFLLPFSSKAIELIEEHLGTGEWFLGFPCVRFLLSNV